jgi:AraC-like DNA-binding protein
VLTAGDGFSVCEVRCPGARPGFDPPEVECGHVLVAAHRGVFVRRAAGREVVVDGSVAYLGAPGTVEEFAHPVPGGDACTVIGFEPALIAALDGGDPELSHPALPVDAASELALRQLAGLARDGDPDGSLAERVTQVASCLLARRFPDRVGSGRPATAAARRRLVGQAKAALAADLRLGLIGLSRALGCSPHHLSRVFTQLTGCTVSKYRNRLRVSLALERIADGEHDLAALAADLGFSDHSHLTRTIRAATGHPPCACRALLTRREPPGGSGAAREPAVSHGTLAELG